MAIKKTLAFKKFFIGGMMRIQQAVDAMNSSEESMVDERKQVLAKCNELAGWLERPYSDKDLALEGLDIDGDLAIV